MDLKKQLARAQLERAKVNYDNSWKGRRWQAAMEAFASGWRLPKKRFPVVITEGGPVAGAEDLQRFFSLAEPHKTLWTHTAAALDPNDEDPDRPKGNPVQVCDVSQKEYLRLWKTTDGKTQTVWFDGMKLAAWRVEAWRNGPVDIPDVVEPPEKALGLLDENGNFKPWEPPGPESDEEESEAVRPECAKK